MKRTLPRKKICVVGAGQPDLIAVLPDFPNPDAKVRTEHFEIQGGGNAFNVCVGLSRLDTDVWFVSKVGNDAYGQKMIELYHEHQIQSQLVVRKATIQTAFTYIIVDKKTNTRVYFFFLSDPTCIHTPSESLLLNELTETQEFLQNNSQSIALLYSDTRHTLASLEIVKMAKQNGIKVLLDCEKDRGEGFAELLKLSDYFITNARFPELFSEISGDSLAAIQKLFDQHPQVEFIISTLGSTGSVCFTKRGKEAKRLDLSVQKLENLDLLKPHVFEYQEDYVVYFYPSNKITPIADTIGAGDTFISTILFCLAHNLHRDFHHLLEMATWSAAQNVQHYGATQGMPTLQDFKKQFSL